MYDEVENEFNTYTSILCFKYEVPSLDFSSYVFIKDADTVTRFKGFDEI